MPDRMTKEQRHNCMASIKGKDTKPEMRLRHALFALGFRYRKNVRSLPGSPDIVLARYHTAIFVNGCFWHGHQGCTMYTQPKSNAEFWSSKVVKNQRRDALDDGKLESIGWRVITVWECELKKDRLAETIEKVADQVRQNRQDWMNEHERRKVERSITRSTKTKKAAIAAALDVPKSVARLAYKESRLSDKE